MSDTEIVWRGLTIGGDSPFHVEEISGWDDVPDIDVRDVQRARAHGEHPGDAFAKGRTVTVSGSIANREARDVLARTLMGALPVLSSTLDLLSVETFGRALTARGRLVRRSLPVGDNYASGKVPFTLQWKCPDPIRWGAASTQTTGLPTAGGGLTYPLTYPLSYGALGTTGQLVVPNPGTADSPLLLTVTGGLPLGFEISAAGQRLRYPVAVPSGQVLALNTADGTVLVEDTANRRANLTVADWMQVPAGGALTLQFTSLGGAYDPAATLTATCVEANW